MVRRAGGGAWAAAALLLLGHPFGEDQKAAADDVPVLSAQGFPATALSRVTACCNPDRHDYHTVVANNNLGGHGPDRYKAPARPNEESLRYKGIAAASGRRGIARSVDLVLTASSAYATRSPYKNGLHGSLFQVHVDAGNTVDLELHLRDSATDERVTARELVLLIFDLDEDIGRMSRTAVSASGFQESHLSDTTELRQVMLKDNATWFLSQKLSEVSDEPSACCGSLSKSQQDKMVAFRFVDVSRIPLKVHVSYGRRSHNFLLGVKMCTSCAADHSGTSTPVPTDRQHAPTSARSKVHLESSGPHPHRVETILWSIGDMLHLPGSGGGPQPTPAPAGEVPAAQGDAGVAPPSPAPIPEGSVTAAGPPGGEQRPPTVVSTGGLSPSPQPGMAWAVAANRVCHGSEVMWAWCKGKCQGTCGGGGCHALLESEKRASIDCSLSAWGTWTPCSTTCGIGWHNRMRHIVQPPEFGGRPCQGSLWQMKSCQTTSCSDRTFILGQWSSWDGCDSHSPGYRFRQRGVREAHGGNSIPAESLPSGSTKQMEVCPNVRETNCVVSPWSQWESCNQPCNGGQAYRRRSLELPPSHGGTCRARILQQVKPCNTHPCPNFDTCQMGEWTSWSECSSDCPGSHYRSREIIRNQQACTVPLKEVAACRRPGCVQINCRWGQWSSWGACTCDCGGGTKRRSRQLAASPKNGGKLCDVKDKSEVAACNTHSCDVCEDGSWGPWTTWTSCSASCGTGFRWRQRDVAQQATSCGRPATGSATEMAVCRSAMSASCGDHDCVVGEWSSWSACSCSCFGIRERTRTIARFHSGNGKPCAGIDLKTIEPCNPRADEEPSSQCGSSPPVDCAISPWSVWGQCSVTCGGGNRQRSRHILTPAANHGRSCGKEFLEQTDQCAQAQCEEDRCLDCLWGDWSEWGSCSKCGGERYRHRIIKQLPNFCGRRCEPEAAREVDSCPSECEKVQYCGWREWEAWSLCTNTCGASVKTRQRFLGLSSTKPEEYLLQVKLGDATAVCHGTQSTTEQCLPLEPCPDDCAPINCDFTSWTDWVDRLGCVGLCERRRSIRTVNNECGTPCAGPLEETMHCEPTHCHRQSCRFSPWSEWSGGAEACRTEAVVHRSRTVTQEPQNGGTACSGPLIETKACEKQDRAPATPCSLDVWSDWSLCTASCGSGWRTRFRSIRTLAMNGGALCEDSLEQGEMCGIQPCPDDSSGCALSHWSEWRGCMDYGQQFRTRELNPVIGERVPCNSTPGDSLSLRQTRPCDHSDAFVVDCTVSEWTGWYACDRTCGGGEQQRDRQVEAYPKNGGRSCPEDLRQIRGCNMQACHTPEGECKDGRWEPWSPWSQCSVTCGGGISWRTRLRAEQANQCGKPATGLSRETKYCINKRSCSPDVDCRLSEWSVWSGCSQTCDGVKSRTRKIKVHGEGHGEWCRGPTKERSACDPCVAAAPIDCLLGEWGSWSDCPVTCGSSQIRRERLVRREARRGGRACEGSLVDIRNCGLQECPSPPPVDCLWGQWGSWGACSEPGGQRSRFRHVLRQARFGGQPCEVGAVEETVGCSRPRYQSYCTWAQWEAWSQCSDWTPCRTWGKRSRVRHLVLGEAPDASAVGDFYEASDAVTGIGIQDGSRRGGDQRSWAPPWFFAQGMRLEILMAFACGYLGRMAVAGGSRALARRRGVDATLAAEGAVARGSSSVRAWLGGARMAATQQGYMPVAQAPLEA